MEVLFGEVALSEVLNILHIFIFLINGLHIFDICIILTIRALSLEVKVVKCKQVFHFFVCYFSCLLSIFFICLYIQVLEGVIKYRWNALPVEQRDGMKNFISDVIIQVSSVLGESKITELNRCA